MLGPTKHAQHEIRMGEPTKTCSKCQAWKGQLGLEPTPELYIEHLTEIFNEVKRVLKKEGTLWLNIGDTYSGGCMTGKQGKTSTTGINRGQGEATNLPPRKPPIGLPSKCLLMVPERLAWALIKDGWILRNKIIWSKPNAMPSSVTDRFSNRWEYIFMFSKSQMYYFDLDAVREPHTTQENRPFGIIRNREWGYDSKENYIRKTKIPEESAESYGSPRARNYREKKTKSEIMHEYNPTYPADRSCGEHPEGKNPGDVFEINTQPFPKAHFAVFPEKLCEKPIKAGCPEEACKKCGKARERMVEKEVDPLWKPKYESRYKDSHGTEEGGNPRSRHVNTAIEQALHTSTKIIGWTSCKCNAGFEGGVVLDPFAGAGTVGVVAKSLGRRFILIDIKQEYIKMAKRRVAQVGHQKELFE